MKTKVDEYPNRAFSKVAMSGANTLTFEQVRFAVGTFSGYAVKLTRVEYFPSAATIREIVGANDALRMAITGRDDLSSIDPTNQSIYACKRLVGIAANVEKSVEPYVSDFSELGGGGLILPSNPIYCGVTTSGFASAGEVDFILYYHFIKLSDKETIEVLQTILPGNV